MVTNAEARSEVFWMAFQSLPKAERKRVLRRLLRESEFMEDLIDIAVAKSRSEEPVRPFDEYLEEQRKVVKAP